MHPVLRMITRPHVGLTAARNVWSHRPRWTRGCEAAAGAAEQDRCTQDGSSTDTATTFACVGIDTDMSGGIVLVTCQRNDNIMQNGLGEGQSVGEWCRSGMLDVRTKFWDMPTYQYRLASGKVRRRACGIEFNTIMEREILADDIVQESRKAGRFAIVVERPSPMPDVDGWQSAAVTAYTFGVLMGVLASNGLMSLDQQADTAVPVPMTRRRGRPRTVPSRAIIEVLAMQWKRQMQLQGCGKDGSRDLAAAILPSIAVDLKRKKDHGRAEAALLAVWGIMLSSSHLAARREVAGLIVPAELDYSTAFDEDEQTQRLRKLAKASQ